MNDTYKKETDHGQQDSRWLTYIREIRQGPPPPFSEQLTVFGKIYAGRRETDGPPLVWQPEETHLRNSNLSDFIRETGVNDYESLHRWSVENRSEFWAQVISYLNIRFKENPHRILALNSDRSDPLWLPGARLNCTDSCFQAEPEDTAIISASEKFPDPVQTTYRELEQLVNRVANGLRRLGLKPAERIALYMPMNTACVAAYLGIIRAGCQVVSIADSFAADEVHKRLKLAETRWVITSEAYIRAGRTIRLYDKIRESSGCRAIVIPAQSSVTDTGQLRLSGTDLLWEDFLSADSSFSSHTAEPASVINILFSSGTTGTPKIIPWTHLTPIKAAMDGRFHQDIHAGSVVCWPTNIGWMMGPWLIFASLMNRASIALFEGAPTEKAFIRFIGDVHVSMLGVIPSLVRAWRSENLIGDSAWDHIHSYSSTGEPSHKEDYLWLMSRAAYRAPVIEYLGGTEIGGGHITGSIVKPASPGLFNTPALGIDFVLLDEQGNPVSEGEEGELFLIPPSIGLSQTLLNKDHYQIYYADCPAGPDGQVLRRHGDRFLKLPGGFYKARGRSDDTMNLGGIKVSSVELEQIVESHPRIHENAAISVQPSGEGQEKLIIFAVVVSAADVTELKAELNALLARKLNPLYRIADLVILDHLPRTASNKLQRRKLRSAYLQNHYSDGAHHGNQ